MYVDERVFVVEVSESLNPVLLPPVVVKQSFRTRQRKT